MTPRSPQVSLSTSLCVVAWLSQRSLHPSFSSYVGLQGLAWRRWGKEPAGCFLAVPLAHSVVVLHV